MCYDKITQLCISANSRELSRKIGVTFANLNPSDRARGLAFSYISIKALTEPGLAFTTRNRYLFNVLHAASCCCPAGSYAGYLGEGEILVVMPHCGAEAAEASMEAASFYLSHSPAAANGALTFTFAVAEAGEAMMYGDLDFPGLLTLLRQRLSAKNTRAILAARPG